MIKWDDDNGPKNNIVIVKWFRENLGFWTRQEQFLTLCIGRNARRDYSYLISNKPEKTVTTQIDIVVGYLISFIFYKFMLGCGINGLHNTDVDLAKFVSNLIAHTTRLGTDRISF